MKTATILACIGSVTAFHEKATRVTGDVIQDSYIVTLHPEASLQQSLRGVFALSALDKIGHIYGIRDGTTFKGFSLNACDTKLAARIADMDGVLAIEHNQMAYALAVQLNPVWGLDRVDQTGSSLDNRYYYKDSAGAGVDMYTLDTGIRYTHQDFEGRAQFFFTAFNDDGVDRNGHGTHCSSTMAGVQYGVAKKANLYGGKVLGDNGSGGYDGVIAGVDAVNSVSATRTKVANMSLGGGLSNALNAAVDSARDTVHVVASGNSNANACNFSPASASNAYTVNSMQQGDSRSSFSNFGTCTDIFAPGSSVQAAWSSSDTATNIISGTSMASPHVAGVAALLVSESASLTMPQVKQLMSSLATPNAINNAGTGSPNLLIYNDRDGPNTPAPPTSPPTTPPPTWAPPPTAPPTLPNCGCSANCVGMCGDFGQACCRETDGMCYCSTRSGCCPVGDATWQFVNKILASN
jgi:subtilisin family serine protease